MPIVLVSLGYPVSASRADLVRDAVGLARELGLWLDAVLVTSTSELPALVEDGDRVTIVAKGRERRRIERALDRARPPRPWTANPMRGV